MCCDIAWVINFVASDCDSNSVWIGFLGSVAGYYPRIGAVLKSVMRDVLLVNEVDGVGPFNDTWHPLGEATNLFAERFAPNFLVFRAAYEMAIL